MSRHILIVEDETKIAQLHADYLHKQGYQTTTIEHGDLVIDWVQQHQPDLILLDLMLPGKDGISICREIRAFSSVPIIMVTARVEEIDRILGLEIGANDYICKPFSPREVVARIDSLFRLIDSIQLRASQPQQTTDLSLDLGRFEAHYQNQRLELTPAEFKLLATLSAPPYRVFSRQQLVDHIYDDYRVISDRTVDTHIKNLRKKLEQAGLDKEPIASVYGVGYKWNKLD